MRDVDRFIAHAISGLMIADLHCKAFDPAIGRSNSNSPKDCMFRLSLTGALLRLVFSQRLWKAPERG